MLAVGSGVLSNVQPNFNKGLLQKGSTSVSYTCHICWVNYSTTTRNIPSNPHTLPPDRAINPFINSSPHPLDPLCFPFMSSSSPEKLHSYLISGSAKEQQLNGSSWIIMKSMALWWLVRQERAAPLGGQSGNKFPLVL